MDIRSEKIFPPANELAPLIVLNLPQGLNEYEQETITRVFIDHFGKKQKTKNEIRIESNLLITALTENVSLKNQEMKTPVEQLSLTADAIENLWGQMISTLLQSSTYLSP